MPTPSSDHLARERTHTFSSTCPEEQSSTATPPSPSSWHPLLPPPPYSEGQHREQRAVQVPESSSSPISRSDDGPSPSAESPDDMHKATDMEEEDSARMLDADDHGTSASSSRGVAVAEAQDGVIRSDPAAARRRRLVDMNVSDATPPPDSQEVMGDRGEYDAPCEWEDNYSLEASEFPSLRIIPMSLSSYLRPGSRFTGTQQSERQVYDVQVEIKHVDLRDSFLCGYLRIQGLTEDHPTLTTYFEGEIIGTKYSFITKHDTWGANDKTDITHWSKFTPFRPLAKSARKGNLVIKDFAQREHIFMRWKEHFLVPDHRVRTINGASFEGFYYICFNQVRGEVTGIYFHSKSEKFQQLELKHVEDRGCYGSLEFR